MRSHAELVADLQPEEGNNKTKAVFIRQAGRPVFFFKKGLYFGN
jgi:hypothetical protein